MRSRWLPGFLGTSIAAIVVAGLAACAPTGDASGVGASPVPPAPASSVVDAGPITKADPDAASAPVDASPQVDASDASDAASSASACVGAATDGLHTITCDGVTHVVSVPTGCAGGGCGIVLDVHGATMNAAMEENNTRMRAIGAREGYVVVQPSAPGTPPTAIWEPARDYPKVWSFFEAVIHAYAIDAKRVHVMGFSQGGRMTFTFACAHADRIASAAPGAETGCSEGDAKAAARPIPMLYMHGKKDVIVPFAVSAAPQRDQILRAWGLGTSAVVASDSQFTRTRYTNASGALFEMIEHEYTSPPVVLQGHCFPGSTDLGKVQGQLFPFGCTQPTAFDWGEEAMAFFKAHPLP